MQVIEEIVLHLFHASINLVEQECIFNFKIDCEKKIFPKKKKKRRGGGGEFIVAPIRALGQDPWVTLLSKVLKKLRKL